MDKCKKCGANDFIVSESYVYRHCNITDGVLEVSDIKNSGGIDYIMCSECETEYSEGNLKEINFN